LNSKVKLAMNKADGKNYAIKIINDSTNHDSNLKAIVNEGKILMTLDHPNIMKVYELREDGNYVKADGTTKKVLYAVLQLANGGEVFDFLSNTGRFTEPQARYYFKQLIEALDHCHSKGFAHRDLKPENLLFDEKYNLLLADFGFATAMAGKDGTGRLRTILGTDNYMAPEIHSKAPYIGSSVDLFAAGIILFIFYTGHPPFNHAKATDSYYNLICMNNHEKFWNFHGRKKPGGMAFFNPQFIHLINAMLAFDPTQRPSIAEIKAHPWYNGETPTPERIFQDFTERKAAVDAEFEKKKQQQELARQQQAGRPANPAFTGVGARFRDLIIKQEGLDDILIENSLEAIQRVESLKLERTAPVYQEVGSKRLTNYYSSLTPEETLKLITVIANSKCKQVELMPEKFKVRARIPGKEESTTIDMSVYVNEFASVVEFSKKEGDYFEYQRLITEIRTQLGQVENPSTLTESETA